MPQQTSLCNGKTYFISNEIKYNIPTQVLYQLWKLYNTDYREFYKILLQTSKKRFTGQIKVNIRLSFYRKMHN